MGVCGILCFGVVSRFFCISRWGNSYLNKWGMSLEKVKLVVNRLVNMVVIYLVGSCIAM